MLTFPTIENLVLVDVESASLIFNNSFQTGQLLTDSPISLADLRFFSINQIERNPAYNEWLALQLDCVDAHVVIDQSEIYSAGPEAHRIVNLLWNYESREIIHLDQLFPDPITSEPISWSFDGNYLLLQLWTEPHTVGIVRFWNNGPGWSVAAVDSVQNDQGVRHWLGAGDLLLATAGDTVTQDNIFYIAQSINGEWHSTEFFRLPHDAFPTVRFGDWRITASPEERQILSCLFDQTLPVRLEVQSRGRVAFTGGTSSRLRAAPGIHSTELTLMAEGTAFDVVGGPTCASGYRWWQLELDDSTVGWAAEADTQTYFLEPVSQAITVPAGDVNGLIAAINAANAAPDPDIINLSDGAYTLTAVHNATDGPNGLPVITSPITINGGAGGATITREASAPEFRLFRVATGGNLTLSDVTLTNGNSGEGFSGGIIANSLYHKD